MKKNNDDAAFFHAIPMHSSHNGMRLRFLGAKAYSCAAFVFALLLQCDESNKLQR